MRRVVQIVGKMTGLKREDYVRKFKVAEDALLNAGYEVINPIKLCAPIYINNPEATDEQLWAECMKVTLDSITKNADAICLLDDVMNSNGSKEEIARALQEGTFVACLNYLTL